MRLVAILASLAVAAATLALPASLARESHSAAASPQMSDDDERSSHSGMPSEDAQSESRQDDDLDARDGDLDDLVAIVDATHPLFVPHIVTASWCLHEARSPRSPHADDALRPPIAA